MALPAAGPAVGPGERVKFHSAMLEWTGTESGSVCCAALLGLLAAAG